MKKYQILILLLYINICSYSYDLTNVISKEELKFAYSKEQENDRSCGFSVVVSLLKNYWNINTTEDELISLYSINSSNVNKFRISFSDMSSLLSNFDISSKGYKMSISQLKQYITKFSPIIVHYDRPEKHFALLLGIYNNSIIVSDPSRGLELLSEKLFLGRYSGQVLLTDSTKIKNYLLINEAIVKSIRKKEMSDRISKNTFRLIR